MANDQDDRYRSFELEYCPRTNHMSCLSTSRAISRSDPLVKRIAITCRAVFVVAVAASPVMMDVSS